MFLGQAIYVLGPLQLWVAGTGRRRRRRGWSRGRGHVVGLQLILQNIVRVARKVAWWMDQSPGLQEERPSHRSKSKGSKGSALSPFLPLAARTGSLPEAPRGNNDRADSPERWPQSEHPWR